MNYILLIKMFIQKYGAISIFCTSTLEYLALPIPSEVILPFVGAIAKSNNQNIYFLTLVCVLGGTLGSLIMFLLGKYILKNLLEKLRKKHAKLDESLGKAEKLLFKYRYIGVFISRTVPLARTFTSIVAGIIGMKLDRFLFFSALGMTIWDFTLIKLGTIYAKNYQAIDAMFKKYSIIIVVVLVIALLIYLAFKHYEKRKKERIN